MRKSFCDNCGKEIGADCIKVEGIGGDIYVSGKRHGRVFNLPEREYCCGKCSGEHVGKELNSMMEAWRAHPPLD